MPNPTANTGNRAEPTGLTIRSATPDDAAVIAEFNVALAAETEGLKLDPGTVAAGVANLLATLRHGEYLLAEQDGRPIGQLMWTREWSDWRNGEWWWVQSVYVHPSARRQGVLKRLLSAVRERLAADPQGLGLRLYVEQDNDSAQDSYKRLGFASAGYVVMQQQLAKKGDILLY